MDIYPQKRCEDVCVCGGGGGLITYNKPILKFQDFQLRNHFANMSEYEHVQLY